MGCSLSSPRLQQSSPIAVADASASGGGQGDFGLSVYGGGIGVDGSGMRSTHGSFCAQPGIAAMGAAVSSPTKLQKQQPQLGREQPGIPPGQPWQGASTVGAHAMFGGASGGNHLTAAAGLLRGALQPTSAGAYGLSADCASPEGALRPSPEGTLRPVRGTGLDAY